ncbi:coagulation factor X-like isoform X2 [Acanthochromis polyacanthus]|uniref:coagulation factor X-like isoform X2 n=1 Tax=Acanthochromis polyacanthus TaxID=80966 RepID=UPI002234C71C|nr:coagulation factor X-like isoform X2 [Acanthochromis polyacanthus]
MFWCLRLVLGLLLLWQAAAHVFLDGLAASQVLIRSRRANSFLEEMKVGNLERECVEERCDWEEAREIFESREKTNDFWAKYVDGDACESLPCANAGHCKDGIGTYTCSCQEGYQGLNCEALIPELCEDKNGGCEHFCNVIQGRVQCSCADGYFLASDHKSCNSNEKFKCGALVTEDVRSVFRYERKMTANVTTETVTVEKVTVENVTVENVTVENVTVENVTGLNITINGTEQRIISQIPGMTRIVNGEACPPGECPWQALLLNEDDQGFCGGTILNEYIILTAAHCMNKSQYIYVKLGEFDTLVDEVNEVAHTVDTIITHSRYQPNTYHNDIALIKLATPIKFSRYILPACLPEQDFAEKVLMNQPNGMVSGFGRLGEGWQTSTILQRLSVPYVARWTCLESTTLRISSRMFCAGYDSIAKDACQGDGGGPHVTRYRDTYFVTGIVSWGEGCARRGKYGIYTQVSKFTRWIQEGINRLVPKDKNGARRKRNHDPIKRLVM